MTKVHNGTETAEKGGDVEIRLLLPIIYDTNLRYGCEIATD